jgi:phage-related tail fiber protein
MLLQFRQGIVRHQIDTAGTATFIRKSGNGENVDLICDNAPFIFTVAHSNNDYLIEIRKTYPNAWTGLTPIGITQYLYLDISLLDASLTFGYTIIPPYYGPTAPTAPIVNQHWFDTTKLLHKVWNGNKWIVKLRIFAAVYNSNAILLPKTLGSQVNLNVPCTAGNIVSLDENTPIVGANGTFVTTETGMLAKYTSAEPLKLEAVQLYAEALEFIPKFSFVSFKQPKKVLTANIGDTVNGLMLEDYFTGEVGNIVTSGLVRNDQWNFALSDINKTLYIGPNGTMTLVPAVSQIYKVGYIVDVDTIMVQLQLVSGAIGGNSNVAPGPGITITENGSISTISLSGTGIPSGDIGFNATQNIPFSVDQYGRITSIGTPTTITPNWSSILNTPTTLAGYAISNAVESNALIVPGTFPKISFDSKGLVTGGEALSVTDIPNLDWTKITSGTPLTLSGYGIVDAQPLNDSLTAISQIISPSGLLRKNANDTWTLDTTNYLSTNQNITLSGDVTGSGTTSIITTLSDTGIIPGAYTRITVDSKGRATFGQSPNTLAGIGIADAYTITQTDILLSNKSDISHTHPFPLSTNGSNGISAILTGTDLAISLIDTGVIPGTYNQVTVDSTGRITNAAVIADNDLVTLSGDVTGSGSNLITTTLSDTGVIPGTYNSLTVDSKGRITSASHTLSVDPLLTSAFIPLGGYQSDWSTTSAIFSSNFTGTFSGTGSVSSPGTISLDLRDTGITAGTYTQVTVDAKGRVITGNNPTTLVGYGITDIVGIPYKTDPVLPLALDIAPAWIPSEGLIVYWTGGGAEGSIPGFYRYSFDNWTLLETSPNGATLHINAGNIDGVIQASQLSSIGWSQISGTPTTLAGYGITDGGGGGASTLPFSSITSTPTTLVGYGITDAISTSATSVTFNGIVAANAFNTKSIDASAMTSLDISTGSVFYKTITGITSLYFYNPGSAGTVSSFILELTNAGPNINWGNNIKWAGGVPPVLTASGVDILGFYTHDSGTTWRGMVLVKDSR